MKKFIPRNKLSKKAKLELDKQQRRTWNGLNPVTRKVESKKIYNRKKVHMEFDDSGYEPFLFNKTALNRKVAHLFCDICHQLVVPSILTILQYYFYLSHNLSTNDYFCV